MTDIIAEVLLGVATRPDIPPVILSFHKIQHNAFLRAGSAIIVQPAAKIGKGMFGHAGRGCHPNLPPRQEQEDKSVIHEPQVFDSPGQSLRWAIGTVGMMADTRCT